MLGPKGAEKLQIQSGQEGPSPVREAEHFVMVILVILVPGG